MTLTAFAPLFPAMLLALGGLLTLLVGSFTRKAWLAYLLAGQVLLGTLGVLLLAPATGPISLEQGPVLLAFSPFSNVAALLVVGLGLALMPLLWAGIDGERRRPELPVLLLLSLSGAALLPAATHLLTVYMALELLSFPLYILCAWARDDARSSEAGLKYFVLGSLASGLMLFGMSLIYAATGALDFATLATLASQPPSPLVLAGGVLLLAALAFKLSLVPFHFYTPDVYEGAPTPVTAMLAALPKLAVLALTLRVLVGPLGGDAALLLGQGLAVLAVASMALGATLAIWQGSLKRLLAYSTVANLGFALVPVVALAGLPHDYTHLPLLAANASGAMLYVTLYAVASVGLLTLFAAANLTTVADLKGLARTNPGLGVALGTLLFSLAGIPPLAGFIAKLLAFQPAVQAGWSLLVLVAVLFSVVAAAYSLWLLKVMIFDASATPSRRPVNPLLLGTGSVLAALTLLLGLWPAPLQLLTFAAATAIF